MEGGGPEAAPGVPKQLLSLFLLVLPAGKEDAQLWDLQRAKLLILRDTCDREDPAAASILRHLWQGVQGAVPSPAPRSCLWLSQERAAEHLLPGPSFSWR